MVYEETAMERWLDSRVRVEEVPVACRGLKWEGLVMVVVMLMLKPAGDAAKAVRR